MNKIFKTIAAFGTMVFFMSCANELTGDAAGLVDNGNLVKGTINFTPVIQTVSTDTVRSNALSRYQLGKIESNQLGNLQMDFVSQFVASSSAAYPLFDDDETFTINTATLQIPLSLIANSGVYNLYSVTGNTSSVIHLQVDAFSTYLEYKNTNGKLRVYYANGTNDANEKESLGTLTSLGSLDYTLPTGFVGTETIEIPLDKNYFQSNFVNDYSESIDSHGKLLTLLKGLKVSSSIQSGSGVIFPITLGSKVILAGTSVIGSETNNKEVVLYSDLARYNLYEHNHQYANETGFAYIQGAGGYELQVDVSELQNYVSAANSENWLVNEAYIRMYIDESKISNDDLLDDLYVYALVDNQATLVEDYATFGVNFVRGDVQYDENKTNPYVDFYLTDYVKELFASGVVKILRIKAREGSENKQINLTSTNPKGMVIFNGISGSIKAPEFVVKYSKVNQ